MQYNPNVSVRMRGVMEKCSYCVQRIQEAKITARRDNRPLRDGDIKVACQQACGAGGITFGDLNDPASRGLSVAEVLEKLAASQKVGASESARFDRALDAYRQVVDQCDLRTP